MLNLRTIASPRALSLRSDVVESLGPPARAPSSTAILLLVNARCRMRKEPARPSLQFVQGNSSRFVVATARPTAMPARRPLQESRSSMMGNVKNQNLLRAGESPEFGAHRAAYAWTIRPTTAIQTTEERTVQEYA